MVFIAFLAALCGLALGVFFICIVLRYFYVESEGIDRFPNFVWGRDGAKIWLLRVVMGLGAYY